MGTNEDWEKMINSYKGKRIPRGRAIKLYCKLQCCSGDTESWKNCTITNCFLWKFRLGRETLAKPNSFKKQRKTTINLDKNDLPDEDMRRVEETSKEVEVGK